MTKAELVTLDESFIEILASCEFDPARCRKRYIAVCMTDDREYNVREFDECTDIEKYIQATCREQSGWYIDAIYDLEKRKKLQFEVVTKIVWKEDL